MSNYLTAIEEIFLLRRIECVEEGVGKDHWVAFDSGLLDSLLGSSLSEGATLSLARTLVLNEISANSEYGAKRLVPLYFKSRLGKSPVDLVWNGIPLKVITSARLSSIGWEERALAGALKTLNAKVALLVAPTSEVNVPKSGIGVVPWSYWS